MKNKKLLIIFAIIIAVGITYVANAFTYGNWQIGSPADDQFTAGLVGFWSFDGMTITGASVDDLSDNSNTGTITGAVGKAGVIGQALEFDGVDDYVEKTNFSSDFGTTDDFTLTAWIYPKSGDTSEQHIVAFGNTQFALTNGTNYLFYKETGVVQIAESDAIIKDEWSHVVIVRNGAGGRELFLNGVSRSSNTEATPKDPSTTLVVGDLNSHAGDFLFNGSIDEVRIYNRALSATEVADHYVRGRRNTQIGTSGYDDVIIGN